VTAQLEVSEQTSIANQAQLAAELEQLNAALTAAELRARETETQYVALSERLNRAMADRIAELNQYQSQFYGAVKMALADTTSVDTSTDRFVIGSDILFARGKYNLSPEGKKQLQLIAGAIANLEEKIPTNINWIIRVDGHTDKTAVVPGTQAYKNNQELSLLRARAVVSELAANGVSPRRLIPAGMGDMYPVQLGTDAESLQANRRIELRLTNP
jgi:chemotaxis protein MotB